tara:strand:- start:2026 stop:3267 length:1242 start_codon:yes stop_codon:yes gene_type:complete
MSEEAVAAPEAEAINDTVEALPEPTQELSFTDALEQALAQVGEAAESIEEPENKEEEEPQAQEPEEPEEAEEKTEEPEAEPEKKDEEDVSEEDSEEETEKSPLDELSEDVGDEWTPKAAKRFKQLKDELKSSTSEIETLRQKTEEYESKIKELTAMNEAEDPAALKEKLEQFEQEQKFNNLEETEAYKQAVTEPLKDLLNQTEQIAEKYGIDAEALIDAVAMEDEKEQDKVLEDLLSLASDRDKSRIFRVIEATEPIMQARQDMYDNVEQAIAEAQEADKKAEAQSIAERVKERQEAVADVAARVSEKLPFLSGIEGFDMEPVREKAAESDPTTLHPVDHAYNSIASQILPTVVKEYASLRKELDTVTDRLAEYEQAEPNSTATGESLTSQGAAADKDRKMSFEDAVNAAFAS